MNSYTYRCPLRETCPFNKNCFVLKTEAPIATPIQILFKCKPGKKDIRITIGGGRPP